MTSQIIFGPVPSRRLGRSIGINNIPYKVCSYSCAYCQVGKAVKMQVERQEFYRPDEIVVQLEQRRALSPLIATLVPAESEAIGMDATAALAGSFGWSTDAS